MTSTGEKWRTQDAIIGRLLVVDDNEINRDMLSRRLSRRGHTVDTAGDGQTALDLIRQRQFDVILLDIMMPGIDGLEVLRIVREAHTASDLPIVMATAKDQSEDVVAGLELGANDYVTKPIDFRVVLARLQTQLALKRATDELARAHTRMKASLEAAARVQQALLPTSSPAMDRARFAWRYYPCDELAGDALSLCQIQDRHVCLYVLDVSGHGVPSALLSVTAARALTPSADPASLVPTPSDDDEEIARHPARGDRDAPQRALSHGVQRVALLHARLRHPRHLHRSVPIRGRWSSRADPRSPERASEDRGRAGLPDRPGAGAAYEESVLQLEPGDRLYLHSDGVDEQMNADSEQFGRQRLAQTLAACAEMSLEESLDTVVAEITAWRSADRFTDDVSILAVEMRA